jgi:uncharacterized protein (TIGR00162 family)
MEPINISYIEKPKLKEPILIEGLPGVGNVGKLAAEHLMEELGGKKFADIYSKYFPPQVLVNDEGITKLVNNELYYATAKKQDIIFLTGDYQGLSPEGQYELSYEMLQMAKEFNVKTIYTLGGYGLGKMVKDPRVLGAATTKELVEEMKKVGVVFNKGEPGSGIVGASGLLLGLGALDGMQGVCLMGETSGYFVDPKSAQSVLTVLTKILGVSVDFAKLETKAEQVEQITNQIKEIEGTSSEPPPDDLRYIG